MDSNEIIFGYDDYWQKSYKQFQQQFDSLKKLIDLGNEILATGERLAQGSLQNHLCYFVRMIVIDAGEVIILCGNGCGTGAIKLVRGMYETQWTAEYLRQNPNEVDDYIEYGKIIIRRRVQWLKENMNDRSASFSKAQIQEIDNNYNNACSRFTDKNGKVRNQWSKKHIDQIAKCIGRQKQYELPYSIACSIHHANTEGLLAHFAQDQDLEEFAYPPSERWIKQALISASSNVYFVLKTLSNSCNLDFEKQIDEAGHNISLA